MGLGIILGQIVESGGDSGIGGGVIVADIEPEPNSTVLWVDTANGGIAKYYDGSAWTPIVAVWG